RHDATVSVRLVALVSRARGPPVRLRLSHPGVHAEREAAARLLHAADRTRRPPERPGGCQAVPRRAPSRGAQRAFRAVVRGRAAGAGRARCRRRRCRDGGTRSGAGLARDVRRRRRRGDALARDAAATAHAALACAACRARLVGDEHEVGGDRALPVARIELRDERAVSRRADLDVQVRRAAGVAAGRDGFVAERALAARPLGGAQLVLVIAAAVANFGKMGMPAPGITGPFIALLELIGGALLLAGIAGRWLGLLFAVEFVVATFLVKLPSVGWAGARLDAMLLASALLIFFAGSGRLSVDDVWLERRRA